MPKSTVLEGRSRDQQLHHDHQHQHPHARHSHPHGHESGHGHDQPAAHHHEHHGGATPGRGDQHRPGRAGDHPGGAPEAPRDHGQEHEQLRPDLPGSPAIARVLDHLHTHSHEEEDRRAREREQERERRRQWLRVVTFDATGTEGIAGAGSPPTSGTAYVWSNQPGMLGPAPGKIWDVRRYTICLANESTSVSGAIPAVYKYRREAALSLVDPGTRGAGAVGIPNVSSWSRQCLLRGRDGDTIAAIVSGLTGGGAQVVAFNGEAWEVDEGEEWRL